MSKHKRPNARPKNEEAVPPSGGEAPEASQPSEPQQSQTDGEVLVGESPEFRETGPHASASGVRIADDVDPGDVPIEIFQQAPPGARISRKPCPQCGGPAWHVENPDEQTQKNIQARYKAMADQMEGFKLWDNLKPEEGHIAKARVNQRKGKRTVVMIGTSPDSCGLVPWDEPGIEEFWSLNDCHHLKFMQANMHRLTRWFQMHHRWRFMRKERTREGLSEKLMHYNWLCTPQSFPIYMQRVYEGVPSAVKYPLKEVCEALLTNRIGRGAGYQRKYFTATFPYMIALAIFEGFERIELYGVELAQQVEYIEQRPGTEWWLGYAAARNCEVYVPQNCRIMQGKFYGYRLPAGDPRLGQIDEDNVGLWSGYPDGPMDQVSGYDLFTTRWRRGVI